MLCLHKSPFLQTFLISNLYDILFLLLTYVFLLTSLLISFSTYYHSKLPVPLYSYGRTDGPLLNHSLTLGLTTQDPPPKKETSIFNFSSKREDDVFVFLPINHGLELSNCSRST